MDTLHLPPVLRWFTANIGIHHVHHLNPSIPFWGGPTGIDTDGTAAGDAFTACLVVSRLEGREWGEALRRACAAGALVLVGISGNTRAAITAAGILAAAFVSVALVLGDNYVAPEVATAQFRVEGSP